MALIIQGKNTTQTITYTNIILLFPECRNIKF